MGTVDQVQHGEPAHGAALLAVYDVAVDEVYRYLHRRCGNRAVAEDLTAETFLAAVGQIERNGVDEVTVAWLIGIARHKLLDEWRRAHRRPRSEPLDTDTPAAGGGHDHDGGEDVWDAVLDRQLVGAVMSELGPHHRSALTLRYFDGLAVPDVATHLGRTVEATETLLVRARRRFRTVYEQQQGGAS